MNVFYVDVVFANAFCIINVVEANVINAVNEAIADKEINVFHIISFIVGIFINKKYFLFEISIQS